MPPKKEEHQSDDRRKDGVTITLPWGMDIKIRGLSVISSLTFAAVCVIAYLLWDHRQQTSQEEIEMVSAMKNLTKSQLEMNYILTLNADQRQKLDLQMPDSLRERIRDRQ